MTALLALRGAPAASAAISGLLAMREWERSREGAARAFLGRNWKWSDLRERLMAEIVVRSNPISSYVIALATLASPSVIRREIYRLEDVGLIEMVSDPADRRAWIVTPAPRLIAYCEAQAEAWQAARAGGAA